MSKSVIVIGDCHGCYITLVELIKKLPEGVPICFAGDLVDRGPRSREVVELVKNLCDSGKADCVRGNHEDIMLQAKGMIYSDHTEEESFGYWFSSCGGDKTVQSYIDHDINLQNHLDWMIKLPLYKEYNIQNSDGRRLVVSHSSIGKVYKWSAEKRQLYYSQFKEYVMWNRNPPHDPGGIYNVFGHTPQEEPRVKSFYANVDTGAVFTGREKYGKLTALQFPEMKVYQQVNIDD